MDRNEIIKLNCFTDFPERNYEDFRRNNSSIPFLLSYVTKIVGREFLCKTFSLIKSLCAKWRLHIERDLVFRSMDWCFSIAAAHCLFFSPSLETLKTSIIILWFRTKRKCNNVFIFTGKNWTYTSRALCIDTWTYIAISFKFFFHFLETTKI